MKATVALEFDSIDAMRAYFNGPVANAAPMPAPAPLAPPPPATTAPVETRGRPAGVKDAAPRKRRTAAEIVAGPKPEPALPPEPPVSVDAPPAVVAPAVVVKEQDVQDKLSAVFQAVGLEASLDLLSRYGAKRFKDLQPAQYAAFMAHADRVILGGAGAI